eukprot:CCRYP_016423-RA/>CCRYP_016423-RA protein AED:0.45 eAED:0.56 QI:0/0/0/1/0/0/2/0/199
MVITTSLQHSAVAWFHHYLQHPRTKRLEETLRLSMYLKGIRTAVQSHVKKCHSCQVNKRRQLKYGKLPTKLAITNPFEIVELPVSQLQELDIPTGTKGQMSKDTHVQTKQPYFDKTTATVVLKTSPGAAIFGRDMLFDVPYIADWSKIGEYRQKQTDKNTRRENASHIDGTTSPVTKYCCKKTVSPTKQKASMKVILGP